MLKFELSPSFACTTLGELRKSGQILEALFSPSLPFRKLFSRQLKIYGDVLFLSIS